MPNMDENQQNKAYPFADHPRDKNEFINADETIDDSPDNKSEADKAKDTTEEDFESFDVDKVDDLERSKNEPKKD